MEQNNPCSGHGITPYIPVFEVFEVVNNPYEMLQS
jgi:hypothetical protein